MTLLMNQNSKPLAERKDMSVTQIENWFKTARPETTLKDFATQLGVHFEEVAEMLETLSFSSEVAREFALDLRMNIEKFATSLKNGTFVPNISEDNREDYADSLADQIVTAIGCLVAAEMNASGIVQEVADSNDSKFVNGKPLKDENGKITKGPSYWKPNLSKFV